MASISSVKSELMSEEMSESIEVQYKNVCLDLNLDNETKCDAWNSYEDIRKHYVLEGDQLHWLAVSLYVSCRKNKYLSKSDNNPISISRLLKSSNDLELIEFFDKLHKWEDMENLPDSIRNKIDQIEHSFNISSIIFQKYSKIFVEIFGGNKEKLIVYDYLFQRTSKQINPKLNQKNKQKKCSHYHLYSLIWTIYALAKTIYPPTINDLIASFHLLIASFQFVYQLCKKAKLDYLLKGVCLSELGCDCECLIDKLCSMYSCSPSMTRVISEEHLKSCLFKRFNKSDDLLNENNYIETINEINRQYDEIVLTNCIIDERIFLENKIQLNDLLNSLNENRNCKSLENRTPLTANQHLTFVPHQSNPNLTPISQANQLIQILYSIIQQQQTKPNNNLSILIGQRTFLDDLVERINEWERIFIREYNSNEKIDLNLNSDEEEEEEDICSGSCKSRFDLSLKLFYLTLENILTIDKKRLLSSNSTEKQIEEQFHKLILNNEFLKSLLGLCLLLVLFCHCDKIHDLNWILNIYSLHGYSFLKIIQIFLKSTKQINQSRPFIKYLSAIEETILSSMVFSNDSALWNEIKLKGILSYQIISFKQNNHLLTSPSNQNQTNLTQMFSQSPNTNHVARKLFQNSTTNQTTNELSIIRSRSDPVVENSSLNVRKSSPYTMFYRKLYELVLSRLDLICLRLYGAQSNQFEKYVWNLFLYLFENYTELLFRSRDLDQILLSCIYYSANSNLFQKQIKEELTWFRLIQSYKSMPNSKLKTVRSVFIRSFNENELFTNEKECSKDPCLTPSKPAGTIHIIDGNIIGDITSFYKEIFLNLPNLNKILNETNLIDVPIRSKTIPHSNEHIVINLGQNIFVDYSSNNIQNNLFSSSTNQQTKFNSNSNQTNNSTNILSSSIQAGANNTVQTTRMRTEDGKFLTTISTISKLNHFNEKNPNPNQTNILFGQPIKRTLSEDSNSNSLNSLTKKVLQIENDRQKIQH